MDILMKINIPSELDSSNSQVTSDQFKLCFWIHNNGLETISIKEIN